MNPSLPTRTLREHPDIDQLKRQANELLQSFLASQPDVVAEVNSHFRGAEASSFALHDAQLVLARAYGFDSWPKLKAFVDGANARRLFEAVRANDVETVKSLLKVRPELAQACIDNLQSLHHAVFNRSPEMVRLLMHHGADAHQGIYPFNQATSPYTIAIDRGYEEISQIIREHERAKLDPSSRNADAIATEQLFSAVQSGDEQKAIAILQADLKLIQAVNRQGMSPLYVASSTLNQSLAIWLLEHGANPNSREPRDMTPLDAAASQFARQDLSYTSRFREFAEMMLARGASMTARTAVAMGDAAWIRQHATVLALPAPLDGIGGLLRVAVTHCQTEMLSLLLDLGADPDERVRVPGLDDVEFTWGFPLWECAATSKHEMAEILLHRGADPNAMVYASGTAIQQAYGQRDRRMIELLQRYGAVADVALAALHRMTDLVKKSLGQAADRAQVAREVFDSAACGGDFEIVRLTLPYIDVPPDNPRWFGALEATLRFWNHGSGHWCHHEWDRTTYLESFRLILTRCNPNLRGRWLDKGQSGFTILHLVTGKRAQQMTAAEQVDFATALLDAGASLDIRDSVLKSTPLGWACRWGRIELVKLFLERGADPIEPDAEAWAKPIVWAEKMGHEAIASMLRAHGA